MTVSDFDFSRLNPEQKKAVETTQGPVLVLSGAGTGKTTVLTARLAYLIQTGKALPFQCLAVTFTNKAAKEMQERLATLIGEDSRNLWLGTFHRIGLRILRNHPEKIGLSSGFGILDSADQERLLKQIMIDQHIDLKEMPPQMVLNRIQRLKDQGLSVEKADLAPFPVVSQVKQLYGLYQERLKAMNVADFGDLLLYCLELFQNYPEILNAFRKQFKYILVDEYQDTNVIQYLWLRLLAAGHGNICCVGDDDQSIYSWRGAEIGNILRFEEDFPEAKIIRLESNYRSTTHILSGASGLIAHNKNRLGKTLHPADATKTAEAEKIKISGVWNGEDEAEKICDQIETEQRHGTNLSDIAILVRAGFQMRAIEDALLRYGLSYKVIGAMRFYEREEIRDATAYIRLLVQPKDDMAFTRIVNKPRRGIGDTALLQIRQTARERRISLYEAAEEMLKDKQIKGTAKNGLERFFELYRLWREEAQATEPDEMLRKMLEDSGYMEMRRMEKTPESEGRIENLRELIGEFKGTYDTFEEYLEYISLVTDNDNDASNGEHISIMTLHAAKGLEFDVVFLPGWEEDVFPNRKALDEGNTEEERRLAYVGITRAKKRVYISFAGSRRMFNQWQQNPPSRFIDEIPSQDVELNNISSGGTYAHSYNDPYDNKTYFYPSYNKKKSYFGKTAKAAFQIGAEVYHSRYGYGKVVAANGENTQVLFEDGSIKKILSDYLEIA